MSALEARYLRILRWYPRQWRARNEAAVIGVLLDQAQQTGRMSPSIGDQVSLALGGLHERFLRAQQPSRVSIAALGLAPAFSLWYLAVIAWSPGIPAYAGTLGYFSNPAATTALIFGTAFALAVGHRLQLARLLSLFAAAWALMLLALNLSQGWLGPGEAATAFFVGFAIVGALRVTRWRQLLLLVIAVMLATLSVATGQIAVMTFPVIFVAQFWVASLISVASGAGVVFIVAVSARAFDRASGVAVQAGDVL